MKINIKYSKIRKPLLLTLLVLGLIISLVFHYTQEVRTESTNDIFYDSSSSGGSISDPTMLSPGNTVTETVKLKEGHYKSLAIYFSPNATADDGTVTVNINGKEINKDFTLNCSDIQTSPAQVLKFDKEITVGADEPYNITIKSNAASQSTAPSIENRRIEESDTNTPYSINGQASGCTLKITFIIAQKSFIILPYIIGCGISILFIIGIYLLCRKCKKIKIEAIAVAVFAVLSIGYSFVFSPMTVPDEEHHYVSAYDLSNKMMFQPSTEKVMLRADDAMLCSNTNTKLSAKAYFTEIDNFDWTLKDDTPTENYIKPITNRPLSYIAPAIGLTIGRLLHLGAYPTFFLGRLMNLLLLAICLYLAMKLLPFGKIALFAIATFPMTLSLSSSYSYDCFNIGLCFVLFAYLVKLIYSDKLVSVKDFIIVTLLSVFVLPYKVAYIGIGFLAFLIPKENFKTKARKWIYKLVFAFSGIIAIVPMQISSYIRLKNTVVTSGGQQVGYYTVTNILTMPKFMITMFARTLSSTGDWYYNTMIGNLLGWFQVSISSLFVVIFTIILLTSVMKREDEIHTLKQSSRLYVGAIMVATLFLVMVLMTLDWTPFGSLTVLGVQGRYFLPILPLLLLVARNDTFTLKRNIDKYIIFASAYVNIFVLLKLFIKIIGL